MNIPAIGTFQLIEVPASLDVVNKLINPPGYILQFSESQDVKDHQLSFLASSLQCDRNEAQEELKQFGATLRKHLDNGAFLWKGLGTLELSGGVVNFLAAPQMTQLLQPVPAERVHRDRHQQTVLIGDREVQTMQEEIDEVPNKKRSPAMIIAWILIFLSLAFIAFHFYNKGLIPSSSGNQMKIKVEKSK